MKRAVLKKTGRWQCSIVCKGCDRKENLPEYGSLSDPQQPESRRLDSQYAVGLNTWYKRLVCAVCCEHDTDQSNSLKPLFF